MLVNTLRIKRMSQMVTVEGELGPHILVELACGHKLIVRQVPAPWPNLGAWLPQLCIPCTMIEP